MTINLTQKFVFETDDTSSLISMFDKSLKTIFQSNIAYKEKLTTIESISDDYFDDGSKCLFIEGMSCSNPKNNTLANRLHLLSITYGYMQKYHRGSKLMDVDEILARTSEIVEEYHIHRFFEKCGDGYNSGFNEYDGSVDIGYQLELGHHNLLHLSMVHIYYGK